MMSSDDANRRLGQEEQTVDNGIQMAEAAHKVYGKSSKWVLFISLGLASYIYSLESQTTYSYLAFATSSFNDHSFIATIQVAQAVIIATFKPVIARLSDVSSRGTAYIFVLAFYEIGYIVIASARRVEAVAGGIVIYAVGYTGLQLLTQVIIADLTTLRWRGLVSGLMSLPFVVNAFVGANISTAIIEKSGWRWGYGMFAILVPFTLAPVISTLIWGEFKAKRLGLTPRRPLISPAELASQMDLVGLILLGTSLSLILLPLTLAKSAENGWKNPSMIAMIVIGFVLVPVFGMWEKHAKYPVVPGRFFKNPTVSCAAFIDFFDFISFYLTFAFLYSFIMICQPWPLLHATYFTSTQSVALTVFGILAGAVLLFVKRTKWTLVTGLAIRLLGVGLMIHSRGARGSTAELVITQVLQGWGGGFASVISQVAAQASVPHVDTAMATAFILLFAELGNAFGNAISGAMWTNQMPERLAHYLPNVNATERATIFANMAFIRDTYPIGSETRNGIIHAYSDVMKNMLILATCLSVIPLVLSLFMPDWRLNDAQNAIENVDLAGGDTESTAETDSVDKKNIAV